MFHALAGTEFFDADVSKLAITGKLLNGIVNRAIVTTIGDSLRQQTSRSAETSRPDAPSHGDTGERALIFSVSRSSKKVFVYRAVKSFKGTFSC